MEQMPPLTGQLDNRRGFLRPQLQAVGPAPLTHSPITVPTAHTGQPVMACLRAAAPLLGITHRLCQGLERSLFCGVLLISVWPGSWYFEASEKAKQRKMELAGKEVRTGGGQFGG